MCSLSGWLTKKGKLSGKWKRRWFTLAENELLYGDSKQSTPKRIPLEEATIKDASAEGKNLCFSLKPRDQSRTYYLRVDTREELDAWMQAICVAKISERHGDSQACSIQ
ncbi:PREDICTED: pleckstrin-2-like [Priapulus caudatus]|uniref:Pleckstrin-2-like n=1 Tax=Priapulus caudatus TaxID=37621 RepID=A0ABM1EH35_PRICU|nr:PREDICTED: pleckstrin-2-like [Priapulus caudatus]